nr:MAG TPA: hypothetical protein [Caudoviricetes sp.]
MLSCISSSELPYKITSPSRTSFTTLFPSRISEGYVYPI